MTDPSSQNPSDREKNQDPENDLHSKEKESKPDNKLKLKQLLTPISPHLNVEHKKESDEEDKPYRPKMEIPRAVPIDPEPESQPHEIAPGIDDGPATKGGIESGHGAAPQPPPVIEDEPLPDEDTGAHEESVEEESREPETLVTGQQARKKPGKFRKLAVMVVILLAAATAIHYFFDPLGLSVEATNEPAPVVQVQSPSPGSDQPVSTTIELEPAVAEIEEITLDSFITKLEKQEIVVVENPRGAIINSVFFSEGSMINPQLGLTVESVQGSGRSKSITLVDNSGNRYELPAN